MLGDHGKAFHRRDGIAREMEGELRSVSRLREGARDIAVNEIA
jgi:hypothetical protein